MPAEVVTSENLAEFNASRIPGYVAEVAEEDPEVKEDPKAEPEDDPEEEPPKEEKPKRRNGINDRFSEMTAKQRAAEARAEAESKRAEAAEARAKELEERLSPKPKAEDGRPKQAEYTDPFEYAEKLAEWTTQKALKDRDAKEAKAKADSEAARVHKAWQERIAKVKVEIPDFEEDLKSSDLAVSDDVRDAIIESEQGPQILHFLAVNPDRAEAINGMTVKAALREIGRLEAKLEKVEDEKPAPKGKTREPLPEPITPVKAKAGGTADAEGLSFAEYKAKRAAGKI